MHVALLLDIDRPDHHVGSEAMALAVERALSARGLCPVLLLTPDEDRTRARRPDAATAPSLELPHDPELRLARLRAIERSLAGEADALPPEDPVIALLEALRGADALLIGGGVLDSRHDGQLCERAAAAAIATSLGLPVVLSGQMLGPELLPQQRPVLARLLEQAVLVGLRDPASLRLARELSPQHPGLRPCPDDAAGWALEVLSEPWAAAGGSTAAGAAPVAPPAAPVASSEVPDVTSEVPDAAASAEETAAVTEEVPAVAIDPTAPRIVAAFSPAVGPFAEHEAAEVFAVVLDALVARTGGSVELVPHQSGPGADDAAFHRRVAARMRSQAELRPLEDAPDTLRRTLTADYVVTSRCHPAVFGLAGGAVVLPIAADRDAEARLEGALSTWGISGQVVPLAALITPRDQAWDTHQAAQRWTQDAVDGQRDTAADLLARRAAVRETAAAWWDGVLVGLSGALPGPAELPEVLPSGAGTEFSRALRRDWSAPQAEVAPDSRAAVAVVLRTRDRPLELERALEDVLAQTFADWRLVIVVDGGDPEPVQRLVEARADRLRGRARVITHRRSLGREAAANRGVRESRSDYVVRHDDDGTWHPLLLQRAIAFLERPSCTDHGVVAPVEIVRETVGETAQPPVLREGGRAPLGVQPRAITLAETLSTDPIAPVALVYRRELHDLAGDYDESLPAAGDWEFRLRVTRAATIGVLGGPPLAFRDQRAQEPQDPQELLLPVRERHLQEWTRENGIGLPLWMAGEMQDLRTRLADMQADTARQHQELLELVRSQSRELAEAERRIKEHGLLGRIARLRRRLFRRR